MAYLFDSSAIDKRYVQETGTAWVRRLTRHGDRIFVSIGERLREIVDVDWSAFQLAVARSAR